MRKSLTALIPLILTVLCLGYAGFMFFSNNGEVSEDVKADIVSEGEDLSLGKTVSVLDLSDEGSRPGNGEGFYVNALGVVEVDEQSEIFGAPGSVVKNVYVKDGEKVNEGDLIMELSGANGTTHQYENQYKIALQSYESAKSGYENTVVAMDASVKSAELQVASARKQAEAGYIDYLNIVDGVGRAQRGISLAEDSLYETRMQNRDRRDDLVEAIFDLEDELYDLDYGPERDAIEIEIDKLEDQLDALDSSVVLAENQLMGQVEQSYSQYDSAKTASESMLLKLGYEDGAYDSVKMAEQGLASVIAQKNSAVAQAESQLEMAKINLESAVELRDTLFVKAPLGGVIGGVNYVNGQIVSGQMPVAVVYGDNGFVLKASVDIESSQNVDVGSLALVTVAGREMKLPVLSVGGSADARTRLIDVKVKVGKLPLTVNQTLDVKLPLNLDNGNTGSVLSGSMEMNNAGRVIYLPLDTVIVATEEIFVYVVESIDADGKSGVAKRVSVETGEIRGDVVEIIDGLRGDEIIIVEGARDVKDGEKVIIE